MLFVHDHLSPNARCELGESGGENKSSSLNVGEEGWMVMLMDFLSVAVEFCFRRRLRDWRLLIKVGSGSWTSTLGGDGLASFKNV